jgi:xylitol oxidase
MNYGADSVGFHFSWHREWPKVEMALHVLETALAPFDPRPHWGKLFVMDAHEIQSRYPRLADFRDLANRLDPHGKFRNDYIDTYVFG